MHNNIDVALKPNFMSSLLCRVLYFLKYEFSIEILDLHNKSLKIFTADMFCLKCCLNPDIPC